MRLGGVFAVFAAAAATSACLNFNPFGCQDDTQCDAEPLGQCQPVGYCSYPDQTCLETGQRYENNAGDGLGGECVGPISGTSSTGIAESNTDPPLDTSESASSSTSVDPDSGSDDPTTGMPECGGGGEECCAGDSCDAGLSCSNGTCGCIASIAVGDRHTCAVKLDGSVWCWGDNTMGQLAAGAPMFSPMPLPVPGFGPGSVATQVYARNHNCATLIDDTLYCWGDNIGQKVDFGAPLDIITTPVAAVWAEPAMQVGVGGTHTCTGRGAAFAPTCWGANGSGQLTGTETPGPVIVGGGFEPNAIALGEAHSCMSTLMGQLFCWGDNGFGQLGIDNVMVPTSTVPQNITIPPIGQLVAGMHHTCALTGSDVMCWGRNDLGQVGDGTGADTFTPTTVTFPPGSGMVGSLVAAADQTCAIMATGDLYCWGGNQFGELLLEPDMMTGEDGFTLSPQLINVGFAVAQMATGVTHSCALTTTGQMMCWGENGQGQIGDGNTSDAQDPTPVDLSCP